MKRTTIMVEEELLYEIKQIAQRQNKSASSVIREALAVYVTEQHKTAPPENPLLSIIGLGASEEIMDLSDGKDEELLREGLHPLYGWSLKDDSDS
ncbi:MAG: ribbon-helix-helix protein, CopG family [Chloroflexi bacterium]|nr:ribbon-helix-helix protein, CopG family [Chloroflexota bacterium]